MITVLLSLGVTFLGSYLVLKRNFKEWSYPDRGFAMFEKSWHKIFLSGYGFGVFTSIIAYLKSDNNANIAFIVGLMAGMIAIAVWTDLNVYKVPSELSDLTTWFGFIIMAAYLGFNQFATFPVMYYTYLPVIYFNDFLTFAGICAVVGGLAFIGFLRIKSSSIAMLSLLVTFTAVFLIGYALLSGLSGLALGAYWHDIIRATLIAYTFLGLIAAFDIFLDYGIGKADIKILYALGFAFSWWFSAYLLAVAFLVGVVLQLLLSIVAKPLNLGYPRTMKNKMLRKLFVRIAYYIKYRKSPELKELSPMATTHIAHATPFVPMLATGLIGGIIYFL